MSYADGYHKKLDKCFEEEKLQLTACKRDCSDTYASFGDTKNTEDIADSLSTQRSPMIDETDIYNSMSI